MKPANKGRDVEDQNLERIVGRELQSAPVGVVEHEFDIGFLSDDIVKPVLIFIIVPNLLIEVFRATIGECFEIDVI